jgi:hypothetical protein
MPQRRGFPAASDRGTASRTSPLVAGVDCILFSDALVAEGALMFAKACELGRMREAPRRRLGKRRSAN